jgi:hypothetical protein
MGKERPLFCTALEKMIGPSFRDKKKTSMMWAGFWCRPT